MQRRKYTRGAGRVFARGGIWWIRYSLNGHECRESAKSRVRKDAVDLLRHRLVKGRGSNASLAAAFELVEQDYRRRGLRSLGRARAAMRHLLDFFEEGHPEKDVRLDKVTAVRASAYVDARLAAKVSPATAQYEMRILSRAFTLAKKHDLVTDRPALPTIEVDNAREGCPKPEEVARVLAALPEGPRELIEFLSITGWRKTEALELAWSQVDFAAGRIALRPAHTKTKTARIFPFAAHRRLAELLESQRLRARDLEATRGAKIPTVFFTAAGEMIQEFRAAWRKAITAAEVPTLIPHDLRRYAAVQMIRAGVGEHVAMKLLGHKTPHIFRRYHIVAGEDLWAGVARLAALGKHGQKMDSEALEIS